LLKVALKHQKSNQSLFFIYTHHSFFVAEIPTYLSHIIHASEILSHIRKLKF
jgi:hypothetical protein